MTCKQTDRLIEVVLFGQPDGEQAAHLAACADCRDAAEAIRRAETVLNAAPAEKAPADLWDRIERERTRPPVAVSPIRLMPRWAVSLSTAALLLLAVGLWNVFEVDSVSRLEIVQGGIPDADFFLSEHRIVEQAALFTGFSKDQ